MPPCSSFCVLASGEPAINSKAPSFGQRASVIGLPPQNNSQWAKIVSNQGLSEETSSAKHQQDRYFCRDEDFNFQLSALRLAALNSAQPHRHHHIQKRPVYLEDSRTELIDQFDKYLVIRKSVERVDQVFGIKRDCHLVTLVVYRQRFLGFPDF